jgi:YidC/Oxa1 family membrane protein insertase
MFSSIFHTLIYDPLYNALIFFIEILPGADVGLALIALTLLVKVLLFPLAHKVARTQVIMRRIQPEVDALQKEHKDDKQTQTLKTLELYRTHKINPFFGILVLFIQLPILMALYWIFYRGGLPVVNTELLYSFIPTPESINMLFLGIVDMAGKSAPLALLAGVTQLIQTHIMMPKAPEKTSDKPNLKEDLARSMHIQMKYVMPVIVAVIAYVISAAIALYLLVSNIFTIGQELLVRKQLKYDEQS